MLFLYYVENLLFTVFSFLLTQKLFGRVIFISSSSPEFVGGNNQPGGYGARDQKGGKTVVENGGKMRAGRGNNCGWPGCAAGVKM